MSGEFEPGTMVAGYTIERVLGRGGMGTVYLAQHPNLPRKVALKLLHVSWATDDYVRSRFESEADHAARLEHPNIVTIHDRGHEGDTLWIAMQYVPGADAKQALKSGPVDIERVVRIISETANALDHAHQAGVLHRDVKPANILLAPGDPERVLLTDFGTAKALDETHHLTKTGTMVATLLYAAPEQIQGGELDHRVDIYALGCTLFHLLTGQPPYSRGSAPAVMHAHLNSPIPRPSALRPELSGGFDIAVAGAMAKNRDNRYSTCRELADAARAALLDGPEVETRPTLRVLDTHSDTEPHQDTAAIPDAAADQQTTDTFQPDPPVDPTPSTSHPRRRKSWWTRKSVVIPAITVAALLLATTIYAFRPDEAPPSAQVVMPFTDLDGPIGVSVSISGDVYVADSGNRRVMMLPAGSTSPQVVPFTGLDTPQGVAVGDTGEVYVVDTIAGKALMLRAGAQTELPFQGLLAPFGVAARLYSVYVADTVNNRVLVLAGGSTEQKVLPFPGLIGPYGVAVSSRGDVYVSTTNQVVVLSASSGAQTYLPFGDLNGSESVAVNDAGDVFVSDYRHNRALVLRAGSTTPDVLPFTDLNGPEGIAVSKDGDIYVSDTGNNRVVKLPAGS